MYPTSNTSPSMILQPEEPFPPWPVIDPDETERPHVRYALYAPSPITEPLLHRLLTGLHAL